MKTLKALSVAAESVMLSPGTNEVSDEKWGKIKDSLAAEIANGTIKPFSVKAKKSGQDTKAKTLKDVPPQVAAGIIAGCSSKDTLRAWFKDRLSDLVHGAERALHCSTRHQVLQLATIQCLPFSGLAKVKFCNKIGVAVNFDFEAFAKVRWVVHRCAPG